MLTEQEKMLLSKPDPLIVSTRRNIHEFAISVPVPLTCTKCTHQYTYTHTHTNTHIYTQYTNTPTRFVCPSFPKFILILSFALNTLIFP